MANAQGSTALFDSFSPDQRSAVAGILAGSCRILHGYAGTGKTTILRALQACHGVRLVVFAPTHAAAYVLEQKGLQNVMLVQRLTMAVAQAKAVQQLLALDPTHIVFDESSMIDAETRVRFEGFIAPALPNLKSICWMGDPMQLPPVSDAAACLNPDWFHNSTPDITLTHVHRQDPAAQFSLLKEEPAFENYDISIVMTNATRQMINELVHTRMYGSNAFMNGKVRTYQLHPGQRLICTNPGPNSARSYKNNRMYIVESVANVDRANIKVKFLGQRQALKLSRSMFNAENPDQSNRNSPVFDLSYAVTCHAAQGAEFEKVAIVLETRIVEKSGIRQQVYGVNDDQIGRWFYTALSRGTHIIDVFDADNVFEQDATLSMNLADYHRKAA